MISYYNEIDPYAADWLRTLILVGLIAPGDVDTRSIEDVTPNDLHGYDQCHFFAGIGGWSLALRLAGWPDDRPVWTGSCPCQPFSAAGKGKGTADERHLWPAFHHLIKECRPPVVFGEQVASKDADTWIDLVQTDMEAVGYAVGAVPFPSASVGAPHIRDRLYWVGDSSGARLEGYAGNGCPAGREGQKRSAAETSVPSGLADADGNGCQPRREGCEALGHWQAAGSDRSPGGMADHLMQQRPDGEPGICLVDDAGGRIESSAAATGLCGDLRPSPTNGFWADADWLFCRDGKWRPVEPGTQQMVDGVSCGMGLLRTNLDAWEKVDHATKAIDLAGQVMRALRDGNGAEAIWGSIGRRLSLPEATLLLAAVCQQQGQLGRVFNSPATRGAQEREDALRALRDSASPASGSSQGRGHPEQLPWELGDLVPSLSQAHTSVRRVVDALRQFTGSPLAHGVPARVGRLRAYGNAIVPQVAEAFIRSFCELRGAK